MTIIKDENYFVVHGWMRTRLNLKGNELLVYAVVYGFSQDGLNEFRGSVDYIKQLAGGSERTVVRALNNLENSGLVRKVNYNAEKGQTNGWTCTPLSELQGGDKMSSPPRQNDIRGVTKCHPGGDKMTPNKEDYKEVYKEEYIKESKQASNLKKDITNNACTRDGNFQNEDYNDVLDGFRVFGEYRSAIFRFIGHLKVNFKLVMLNDRLENLIVKLDLNYRDDSEKVSAIDDAIIKGYKRLECECA